MTNIEKTKKIGWIAEYDIIRVIATLFVVIGHGDYYRISTLYGGCDYSGLVSPELISWKILSCISKIIYIFHMPLFMALGGALFYENFRNNRFPKIGDLLSNKFKRLLIPFFVVSVAYSFPIKYITGYYADSSNIFSDFLIGQLFVQGNTHLWYLVALFFVFLVIYCLEKYICISKIWKIMGLFFISVLSRYVPLKIASLVFEYSLWFCIGYYFEGHRKEVNEKLGIPSLLALCAVSAMLFVVKISLGNQNVFIKGAEICCDYLLTVAACMATYNISYLLTFTKLSTWKGYELLSGSTFGIYLYSDSVNYLILFFASLTSPLFFFSTNLGAVVLYAFRISLSLGVSLIVSKLLKSLNVKYVV